LRTSYEIRFNDLRLVERTMNIVETAWEI
jgi:hypothetical protein